MKVRWAALAEDRVVEAAAHIARDRPDTAARWVESLFTAVGALSRFPRRGRPVPELGREDVREIQYQGYRVIYRVDEKRVVVLTVRHGRQRFEVENLEAEPAE